MIQKIVQRIMENKEQCMCKVTVVIPNYNGEKYLVPCLASLYEETRAEIKVIVVDMVKG